MKACPKPNKEPLPEYSIEFRVVAPIASATAAIPVFCCVQPDIDIRAVIAAMAVLSIRIVGSLRKNSGEVNPHAKANSQARSRLALTHQGGANARRGERHFAHARTGSVKHRIADCRGHWRGGGFAGSERFVADRADHFPFA